MGGCVQAAGRPRERERGRERERAGSGETSGRRWEAAALKRAVHGPQGLEVLRSSMFDQLSLF